MQELGVRRAAVAVFAPHDLEPSSVSTILAQRGFTRQYIIQGYKGKQVRDQIHSRDVVEAIDEFYRNPRCGEVYNLGGGKENSVSILESIERVERLLNIKFNYEYSDKHRVGDHICYYSDLTKFRSHYPTWPIKNSLDDIFEEFAGAYVERMSKEKTI